MKDININYEGLTFEQKINLKINYLLSLPKASINVEKGISTLLWVKRILRDERITSNAFFEIIVSRINTLLSFPINEDAKSELTNLQWVLEMYQKENKKGKVR